MTLVEIMIAALLLTFVLGTAILATQRSTGAYRRSMINRTVDTLATRGIGRVMRELVAAGRNTLDYSPPGEPHVPTVAFRTAQGWDGTAVVWGPEVRLSWELAPAEVDNGADDNGNGLIDEGRIVRIQNPGLPNESRLVLVNGVSELLEGETFNGLDDNGNGLVDERGFCFELTGDTLTVRLSVERRDSNERLTVRTLENSVTMRN